LYKKPDVALIIKNSVLPALVKRLSNLAKRGGFYFEVFNRVNDTKLIVLFIEDALLDVQAEIMKLEIGMKDFHVTSKFKVYAREHFKNFNSRQYHQIIKKLLN